MERASIDGAELEYAVVGSGEPVVCIHGAFIADTFQALAAEPRLAGRYRLILYHRRGYAGSSRISAPTSIAEQAADCRNLLGYLGVDRAHVAGHSYGGSVALQLALESPDLVQSLALLEPALLAGESADGYRESLERSVERFREADTATVVDGFCAARWPGYRAPLARALPDAFEQAVADAETFFECEIPGFLDWHFAEAQARRINQPALCVLGGESEALWSRFGEVHRLLLEWLPNAAGFVLPGATHFLQLEDPGGMANALADFWARHPLAAETA
jgi:pimeloyl-ACP methyl ester carboxylesterase